MRLVVEIKARGFFNGDDSEKYRRYKEAARKLELTYFCLTREETCSPYRKAAIEALGRDHAFFLDAPGDWERFVARIVEELLRDVHR